MSNAILGNSTADDALKKTYSENHVTLLAHFNQYKNIKQGSDENENSTNGQTPEDDQAFDPDVYRRQKSLSSFQNLSISQDDISQISTTSNFDPIICLAVIEGEDDPEVKAMHDFLDDLQIYAVNVKEQIQTEKKFSLACSPVVSGVKAQLREKNKKSPSFFTRRLSKLQSIQSMCDETSRRRPVLPQTKSVPVFNKDQYLAEAAMRAPVSSPPKIVTEEQESPTDVGETRNNFSGSAQNIAEQPFSALKAQDGSNSNRAIIGDAQPYEPSRHLSLTPPILHNNLMESGRSVEDFSCIESNQKTGNASSGFSPAKTSDKSGLSLKLQPVQVEESESTAVARENLECQMRKRLSGIHQVMPCQDQQEPGSTAFIKLAADSELANEPCSGASFAHDLVASPERKEHSTLQTPTLEKLRRISGEELEIGQEAQDTKTRCVRPQLNKIIVNKLSNDSFLEIQGDGVPCSSNSFKASPEHQLPELYLQSDPSFEPPHTPQFNQHSRVSPVADKATPSTQPKGSLLNPVSIATEISGDPSSNNISQQKE